MEQVPGAMQKEEKIILKAHTICKKYIMGSVAIDALKDVSFEIQQGQFTSFVGESGCGKSTTLNIISGLAEPTSGHVLIDDQNITTLNDNALSRFRLKNIGFIFQDFNLIDVYTAYENISYPLYLAGVPKKDRKGRIMDMLDKVGMAKLWNHRPTELSGGQKQRVAIARALINNPKIVIADEPTANLDSKTSKVILELMRDLNQKLNTTFIVATHSKEVMQYACTIISLKDGLITNVESQ